MSSMDKQKSSGLKEPSKKSGTLSHVPGMVSELSPINQLSFPDSTPIQNTISQASPSMQSSKPATPAVAPVSGALPLTTHQLSNTPLPVSAAKTRMLPEVTRTLPDPQTGALQLTRSTTTSLRQTTVIRATGKKSSGTMRPPQGRRIVVHVAVTLLLAIIVVGSLLAVVPTGTEGKGYNPLSPIVKYFANKSNNTVLLAQQAATATAVTQDGYDPGAGQVFAGVPTAPSIYNTGGGGGVTTGGGGTGPVTDGVGNHFFWGQCTFWAAFRYHQLTGHYPPWLGNAGAWAWNASGYGWIVSSRPHLHSIIVLAPGVQGAGGYGHVAIVESINADGSLTTSNFNWAGNFGRMTYVTFYPGGGVTFVWAPGF